MKDWKSFLENWEKEVIPIMGRQDIWGPPQGPEAIALLGKKLSFPPATPSQIASLESKLSVKLPPSYKGFLSASNGWFQFLLDAASGKIFSTEEVKWLKDYLPQWIAPYKSHPSASDDLYFVYGKDQDPINFRPEYLEGALAISEGVDAAIYLLNPKVVNKDGEWEAWYFGHSLPGAMRFQSFDKMMEYEFTRIISQLKQMVAQAGSKKV